MLQTINALVFAPYPCPKIQAEFHRKENGQLFIIFFTVVANQDKRISANLLFTQINVLPNNDGKEIKGCKGSKGFQQFKWFKGLGNAI